LDTRGQIRVDVVRLAACSALLYYPETRVWYRAIQPRHWPSALATVHTRVIPSRFCEGASASPQFELLYLAEDHLVALLEVGAMFGSPLHPDGMLPNPRQAWILLNVDVRLQRVADLTDTNEQNQLEISAQELTGDWRGYQLRNSMTSVSLPIGAAPTQQLAQALFAVPDLEGFYALSAKLPTQRNLVIFPQKLLRGSRIEFHNSATGHRHTISRP